MKNLYKFCFFICLFLKGNIVLATETVHYSYSEIYMYDNQDVLEDKRNGMDSELLIKDPFEPINRHIFNINYILDAGILRPISEIYLFAVPQRARKHIGNFVTNIGEPINFFNFLLQGKVKQFGISLGRFMTNSTLGFFGLIDVASYAGMNYKGEDFGQTLGHYKVQKGPYIVAPLLGPTTARDLTGKVADFYMDPFKYELNKEQRYQLNAMWVLHKRASANGVIKTINNSLDPYETAKLLYIQNRENQIRD